MLKFCSIFTFFLILISYSARSDASITLSQPSAVKAISDIRDSIVQKMGWNPEEVNISNMNSLETMIGHATLYEFDIQMGNAIIPLRLSEDVKSWEFVEIVEKNEDEEVNEDEKVNDDEGFSLSKRSGDFRPVLAPFQLAGPLELWIHDADHMRLSVPHDVEAGVLKKVMLTDGAVVTVKGARELSLRQPIHLPLSVSSKGEDASLSSSLMALAAKLMRASSGEGKPLSLRIVGPSSLVASSVSEPDSTLSKLKVKRLAPGSVELISPRQQETSASVALEAATTVLGTNDKWIWPFPSINGSDPKFLGFHKLLNAILGLDIPNKGSFRLLKALATPATFVKMQFELEKKLGNDIHNSSALPEWTTKPSFLRLQFEMTAKVEGDKIVPLNVKQIEPVNVVESHPVNIMKGNATMSKSPVLVDNGCYESKVSEETEALLVTWSSFGPVGIQSSYPIGIALSFAVGIARNQVLKICKE